MKNETINVTMSTDDNYCGHMCALINSILDNSKEKYNFYIFYSKEELSEKNRKIVKNLFDNKNCKIIFKEIGEDIFKKFNCSVDYINSTAYYRLVSFEKILEKKVIYLDLDIIVNCDLKDLWNFSLGKSSIGAVYDYILGLKDGGDYFNSGVLVVNLEDWQKNNSTKKCLDFLEKNKELLRYPDQDALNNVFRRKWKKLPLEFNRQKIIWDYPASIFKISKEKYNSLIKSKGIIHYTGPVKPWSFKYVFPDKKYYLKYLSKTPWREEVNKDISIKNILFFLARWLMYKLKNRDFVEGVIKSIKNAKK